MAVTYGAYIPLEPFNAPIPIPPWSPDNTSDLVSISLSQQWIAPLLGAAVSLLALSTWDTDNSDDLNQVRQWVNRLLKLIMDYQPMMPPIQFRVNPGDTAHWQYSLDSGATWINGPATAPSSDTVITDPTGIQTITNSTGQPLTIKDAIANLTLDIVSGLTNPPTNSNEAILRVDKKIDDAIALFEVILVP